MKIVKTLDKDFCLEQINKHVNLIKEAQEKVDKYFKYLVCVKCSSDSISKIPMFVDAEDENGMPYKRPIFEEIIPRQIAKCNACGTEFDPYTKLVYKC